MKKIAKILSLFVLTFLLSFSLFAQSDACATATEIVSSKLVNGSCDDTGNTSAGSVEEDEEPSCFNESGTGGGEVAGHWWKFYVDSPKARIFVNTDPSDPASMTAPVMQVHVGGCPGSEDVNYCDNDDVDATRSYLEVSTDVGRVALAADDSVFILLMNNDDVGVQDGAPGAYEMCVINRAPNNDDYCNAFFIDENSCLEEQSNFLSSEDGVSQACYNAERSIWYKTLKPADGVDLSMNIYNNGNGIEGGEGLASDGDPTSQIVAAHQTLTVASSSGAPANACPNPTGWDNETHSCANASGVPAGINLAENKLTGSEGDTIIFSIASKDADDKGRFHLCMGTATLPVKLSGFKAYSRAYDIVVKWSTATEKNNNFFIIERSNDGINFEEIHRKDGAGNSETEQQYSYIDDNPFYGFNYYRLTQYDFDGKSKSFPITVANFTSSSSNVFSITFKANPITQSQNIDIELTGADESNEVLMVLMDYLGNQIYIQEEVVDEGMYLSIPTNNLPSGIYIVMASQKNALISRKVVIK